MGQTAGGLPYPEGTEPVRDGDNAIKALADAMQARGVGNRWAAERQNITTGSTGIAIVAFLQPFTSQPVVAGLIEWTYGNVFITIDSTQNGGVNGAAFYLRVARPDGSAVLNAPVLISYIAVGGA